jgi:hypothetical protein
MTKEIKITPALRVQILWESGIKRSHKISRMTSIPLRTCQRFVSLLNSGQKVKRKPGSGGHNRIVPKVERKLLKKFKQAKKPLSVAQIARNVDISKSSALKIMKKYGFRYKKIKRVLSLESKERRVNFCQNMLERISDVGFIIFSDETSFWINRSRPTHSWVCLGSDEEPRYSRNGLHGPKLHVWGAISSRGRISLKIWEKNMDAELYVSILDQKKREMRSLYPDGFIFMQDNDPKHTSNVAKNFIAQNFMELLDWPPYSPDLNPIEEVWSWLKRRVNQEIPKNLQELKNSILKHWRSINPEFLAPFFNSLENRYLHIIKSNGSIYHH